MSSDAAQTPLYVPNSRVGVVLHENYGDTLLDLLSRMSVWVVDTPTNRAAAETIWASRPDHNKLTSLTTFKVAADASAAERCLGELDTIDLHHGEYSTNPPYSELEVFGLVLTEDIRRRFTEAGFDRFEITEDGFVAYRAQRV
jgi:hypothetical protein